MTPLFGYDREVLARFPGVVGGALHARGVVNGASPQPLLDAYRAEQAATLARIGETPLSELPSLAAWRRVFTGFGVEPTKYRSAAEALLRRLTKQGDVPSLSALVDLGNLVSIRYGLPVAVFDLAGVSGGITVRLAGGSEPFADLGSDAAEHPVAGEVVFLDEAGIVHARRWCWRQSRASATSDGTVEVLATVEGHHEGAATDVAAATRDLAALLRDHAQAEEVTSAVLTAADPDFAPGAAASG